MVNREAYTAGHVAVPDQDAALAHQRRGDMAITWMEPGGFFETRTGGGPLTYRAPWRCTHPKATT